MKIKHISDRICYIKLSVGSIILSVLSIYAPLKLVRMKGMPSVTNFSFQCTIAKIKDTENLFLCGNFNGHIGSTPWAMKEFIEDLVLVSKTPMERGFLNSQLLTNLLSVTPSLRRV